MQLFITDYSITWSTLSFTDERIAFQLKKVLRAQKGYEFMIQDRRWLLRYIVTMDSLQNDTVTTTIKSSEEYCSESETLGIAVGYLNKPEKVELLVQKLTEIAVNEIVFFDAKRSQSHEISYNKLWRLEKIILEAVEQSYWWKVPQVRQVKDIQSLGALWYERLFYAEFDGIASADVAQNKQTKNLLVIWPEGGFDKTELDHFKNDPQAVMLNLGKTVLRAETAAIVWAFMIKNI